MKLRKIQRRCMLYFPATIAIDCDVIDVILPHGTRAYKIKNNNLRLSFNCSIKTIFLVFKFNIAILKKIFTEYLVVFSIELHPNLCKKLIKQCLNQREIKKVSRSVKITEFYVNNK